MDNETRPKKRPASQDTLPDTERVTGSSSKKRRTSDGTAKRRRSSAETQSVGRSSAGSSSSTKRRRASTEPLSESRSSTDSSIKRSADSPVNSSTSSSSRKRRSRTATASDRELNTRHQTSSDPEQEIKTGIRAASGPDSETKASRKASSRSKNRIPLPTESTDPEFDQERRDRARRRKKAQMRRRREYRKRLIIIAACAAAFLLLCFGVVRLVKGRKSANATQPDTTQTAIADTITTESTLAAESSVSAAVVPSAPVKATPAYEEISFEPHSTDATDPSNMFDYTGVDPSNMFDYTGVNIDGQDIEDRDSHAPFFNGEFGVPSAYTDVDGIVGFRGNNFRDDPTYGAVNTLTGSMEIARRARWIQQVIPGAATAGPASPS